MRILIDSAIHRGREVFSRLGLVETFEGRTLAPERVKEADALIVRSVTPVTGGLLAGTRVRFVGTTSTGEDHIDVAGLASAGVVFASAAGCNSRTVAEYVLSALLEIAHRRGEGLSKLVLGVVGMGRIGRRVAEWAELLGMQVWGCDPPRAEAEGREDFLSLEALLSRCDVVTLHVPLETTGPHATRRMLDVRALEKCHKDGVFLINTSRGEVVDESALIDAKRSGRLSGLVIDVWQHEPEISPVLRSAATIATPHIAGVSLRARARAVRKVFRELASFLGETNTTITDDELLIKPPARGRWSAGAPFERALHAVVASCVDLRAIDAVLRDAAHSPNEKSFDQLRAIYADRREFGDVFLADAPAEGRERAILAKLGFCVR